MMTLFAAVLLAGTVHAQTQMFMSVSSVTYCAISVSSGTPVRIDNYNKACEGLMSGRTTLKIVNPYGVSPAANVYFAYSIAVSTDQKNSARAGERIASGESQSLNVSPYIQVWAQAEDVAGVNGQVILLRQARPQYKLAPERF